MGKREAFEAFEREAEERIMGKKGEERRSVRRALTIRLPEELWEKAHLARLKMRKRSVNEIIIEALERFLEEEPS